MIRAAALAAVAACSSAPAMPDAPSSPWSSGPALPLARLEPGVTAMGQQLVVLGGFVGDSTGGITITTEVDALDTSLCPGTSCAWNTSYTTWPGGRLADTPVPRHHMQVASLGTILYMLGGLDAPDASNNYPARGDCYSLDTSDPTATWQKLDDMPAGQERGSAGVVVVPPRIYLFGGASTTAAFANVIYYDTSSGHWCPSASCTSTDTVPDLPAPRSHPAAMRRVDGAFVVVGGLAGLFADSAVADVWQLAASASAWQATTPMPTARGGCAYGVVQGRLVCAGGEAATSALKTTELYDAIDDMWIEGTNMPESRAGIQGAAIGQRLFVPGGSQTVPTVTTGFEATDTLFIYSPLDSPSATLRVAARPGGAGPFDTTMP